MIGKVPRPGTGFRGVVSYLMRGRRDAPDPDRVAWAETRNLPVIDPDRAPTVMRATANQSVRCQRPVYHFVISWHEQEAPSDDIMRAIGDTTLADMQLNDHQAILIAHTDTAHKHLHVVVNRVHPETCRAWSKDNDWARLEISLGRQARDHGLMFVPGRHNDPERFGITPVRPRDGEYQATVRKGAPEPPRQWSKQQIANRRAHIADVVDRATSWDHLATELSAHGLGLQRKGQGIILGDDSGYMKLSDLRRDIRLKDLEDRYRERFGDYAKRIAESESADHGRHEHDHPHSAAVPTAPKGDQPRPRSNTSARRPDAQDRSADQTLRDINDEQTRLEEVRAQRQADSADSSDQDDPPAATGAQAATRQPQPSAPDHKQPDANTDRVDAHHALQTARADLDMAHALNRMGISSNLDAARREVEAAQADLEQHLSFKEKLDNQLRDILTPEQGSQPEYTEEQREALREQRRQQRLRDAAKRKADKKKDKSRGGRGR